MISNEREEQNEQFIKSSNPQKTLELAGSWKDMPKEEFDEFIIRQ